MARNGAVCAATSYSERETRLVGCPSWIHIEPCAAPRNPIFGGLWRISGSYTQPRNKPKQHAAVPHAPTSLPIFAIVADMKRPAASSVLNRVLHVHTQHFPRDGDASKVLGASR
jgi:hypothetical protein